MLLSSRPAFVVSSLLSCLALAACASDADATSTTRANPCATSSATYVLRLIEHAGGTCGAIPDQIVNIDGAGRIVAAGPEPSCGAVETDGCTTRTSACRVETNGVTCTSSSSLTFAADGAAASGILSEICTAGTDGCASTYDAVVTRR